MNGAGVRAAAVQDTDILKRNAVCRGPQDGQFETPVRDKRGMWMGFCDETEVCPQAYVLVGFQQEPSRRRGFTL